ncbi:MAG: insulinase family protein [Clostridiales bacterium]|nr:insulinase family protein [Clostridiales bacterium]
MNFELRENKAIKEKYYYKKHSNGLDIYVIPKKMSTSYALFATKFGSIDSVFSVNGKTVRVPDGTAHFLEHKMFENEDGTDTFARYAKTGASANAYTTFERTCYLFSATDNVYESLEILLDFVTHPYYTKETVNKEQGIIGQEIRMYDDNPSWQLYFGMLTGLYTNNPVRIDTAGTTETIAEITPEILYDTYKAFYNPSNMALCICGDVECDKVEEVCDKVLQKTEIPEVKRFYPEEPRGRYKEFVSKRLEVALPMFAVGIKDNDVPKSGEELAIKQIKYELLLEMMFGKSSKFFNKCYNEGIIDSSFSCEYEASEFFAHCGISGASNEPEKVYALIKAEIAEYKKNGLDRNVFERLKRAKYADSLRVFNSTEDIANDFLVCVFSDFDMLKYPETIEKVTFEETEELLKNEFDENDFVLSTIYPMENKAD